MPAHPATRATNSTRRPHPTLARTDAKAAHHKHELHTDPGAETERRRILAQFASPFHRVIRHLDEIYAARQRNEARRMADILAGKVDGVWFEGMRSRWGGCGRRPRSMSNTQAAV